MSENPPPTSEHLITEEEREFFYQVGAAITQWAQIDEILFSICAAVLQADKQRVAIIYYRTTTIGARLAMVDDLVKTVLPPKDNPNGGHDHRVTAAWKSLVNDINEALSIRNQLAHSPSGQRVEVADRSDDTFAITDIWWASYQSRTEKLRGKSGKQADLKASDIKAHIRAVGQLWMHLRDFEYMLPSLLAK